jgi:hypothetical protein
VCTLNGMAQFRIDRYIYTLFKVSSLWLNFDYILTLLDGCVTARSTESISLYKYNGLLKAAMIIKAIHCNLIEINSFLTPLSAAMCLPCAMFMEHCTKYFMSYWCNV